MITAEEAILVLAEKTPQLELEDLLEKLRVLVGNSDTLSESFLCQIIISHLYPLAGTVPFKEEPQKRAIISESNSVIVGQQVLFYDFASDRLVSIQRSKNRFFAEPIMTECPVVLSAFTKSLIKRLGEHLSTEYKVGKDFVLTAVESTEKISLVCSVAKLDTVNRLGSSAKILLELSVDTLCVTLETLGHSFEDGNVQMTYKNTQSFPLREKNEQNVLEAFVAAQAECKEKLYEYFREIKNDSLDAMRRLLPVTSERMNWGLAYIKLGN